MPGEGGECGQTPKAKQDIGPKAGGNRHLRRNGPLQGYEQDIFTLMGVSKIQKLVRARVRILGMLSTPCACFAVTAHLGVGGDAGIKEINNSKKHFVVAPSLLWPTLLWMHVETTPKLMSESKRWGGPGWPIAVIVSLLLLACAGDEEKKQPKRPPAARPASRPSSCPTNCQGPMGASRGALCFAWPCHQFVLDRQ